LAQIAEEQGQAAGAVRWRQEAMTVTAKPVEDGIALAKTATRFHEITVAENALAKIAPAAAHLPAYHEALAQLSVAKKDLASAEKNFAEAVRLDPSNKSNELNLAAIQLQSGDSESRLKASKSLEQLMEDKTVRVAAARALRDYTGQLKDVPALLSVTEKLYDYPEATFRDRISYVQVLFALERPEFASRLTELQNEAVTDPGKMTQLLSWMITNRLTVLALHWIKELPADVINQRPVPATIADCYAATNDWSGLQEWCQKGDWKDLDFLRHAHLAHALREQGDDFQAKSEWNHALQEAGNAGARISILQQSAAKWGWKKEVEELLWALAKDPDKQTIALGALYQLYADKSDTADLYRVVARICEVRPDDAAAQNHFTQLSLLLNRDIQRARGQAETAFKKDPGNAVNISTYAFSAYREGKYRQAVAVMNALPAEELEKPAVAAYYGVFLVASGDIQKAGHYLQKASKAPLLPEEKALVQSAWDKIQNSRP
jgi:Tfp pilus assembly protein PilF